MAAKERAARGAGGDAEGELIAPHGGALIEAAPLEAEEAAAMGLDRLPAIELSEAERDDLALLACGALSPLPGFMDRETYESVRDAARLPDGLAWGLPVVLTVSATRGLEPGEPAVLRAEGRPVAVLRVSDVYPWDADAEAKAVYGRAAPAHPGFHARRRRGGRYLVGGIVRPLGTPDGLGLRRTPRETRRLFRERGFRRAGAIVLATPWRRTDEYALRCALEACDALLVLTAATAPRDLPQEAFAAASRELLARLPGERLLEMPLPRGVPRGGPRSAVQQAVLAQNYGCASFYHADEGGPPGEVQAALLRAEAGGLRVHGVPIAERFHCEACGGVATERSCAHDAAHRVRLSDEDLRETLLAGLPLPPIVARPEIARSLARAVAASAAPREPRAVRHIFPHAPEVSRELRATLAGHRGCVLWLTGLSGSGKSTIAHRLERELLLSGHRVAVLDGDTLRHGLNSDLGFGDEARRENLRRAGEVAKLMLEAGMIVIGSFISPFAAERERVRAIVGSDFYEVHVEAPLEVCEQRDPKGLYRRARAGDIPRFTGISSPYEPPQAPALRLDTTRAPVEECVQELIRLLARAGALRPQARGVVPVAPAVARRAQPRPVN